MTVPLTDTQLPMTLWTLDSDLFWATIFTIPLTQCSTLEEASAHSWLSDDA